MTAHSTFPDRQASPARIEAERGITAQALKDADHRAKIVAAGVDSEFFRDEYANRVFTALAAGVDLSDDAQLIKAGLIGADYIELINPDITVVARFAANLDTVVSAQLRDRRQAVADRVLAGCSTREIAADLMSLDTLRPRKVALIDKLETRRLKASAPPPEPVTRFFVAGKPIATPGNLATLISKAKTGKTAGVGGIIASAVAAASGKIGLDTLGFTASNPEGKALVLFDTEQSQFDAYTCYMRALRRGGEDTDTPWLHAYGVVGWLAGELREELGPAMEQAAKANGGVFAVVLDGVADFVTDVNDPKECNAFVAELHGLANEYDCPIICIIHSNEGKTAGDDARGHLGKQLARKSESNLLLKKVGEVTTITSEKQRKAPITEADGVAFKWSDEEGRHISCDAPSATRASNKTLDLHDLADEVFGTEKALKWKDLKDRIAAARELKGNTPERRITDMKALGVIRQTPFGQYERVA